MYTMFYVKYIQYKKCCKEKRKHVFILKRKIYEGGGVTMDIRIYKIFIMMVMLNWHKKNKEWNGME